MTRRTEKRTLRAVGLTLSPAGVCANLIVVFQLKEASLALAVFLGTISLFLGCMALAALLKIYLQEQEEKIQQLEQQLQATEPSEG